MSTPAEKKMPEFFLDDLSSENQQFQVPPKKPLRAGDLCPICGKQRLEYDGLLNLSCPNCGPAAVGCFT